jgi:hypothetical protein
MMLIENSGEIKIVQRRKTSNGNEEESCQEKETLKKRVQTRPELPQPSMRSTSWKAFSRDSRNRPAALGGIHHLRPKVHEKKLPPG